MAQEIQIGQIYQDKDARRIERFVRVLEVTNLGDVRVQSCNLQGTINPKAPRTYISGNRLVTRFKFVAQLSKPAFGKTKTPVPTIELADGRVVEAPYKADPGCDPITGYVGNTD